MIEFSTSSQLGLMMVTIGINQPHLAFLHICTHAFFKAMLFMCSSSIIHSLNDEQGIRKMGGLFKTMPFTETAVTVGSLALMGTPFLMGFYSKDLITEAANTSYTNAWALTLTLIATTLTAVYSTRIIFFPLLGQPRLPTLILINENNPLLLNAIKHLLTGIIFAGFLISKKYSSHDYPSNNNTPLSKTHSTSSNPTGFILALELNIATLNLKFNSPSNMFMFSNLLGYFPTITHRLTPMVNQTASQKSASRLLDLTWLEIILPKTISLTQLKSSILVSNQKGLIKLYFLSFLVTLSLALLSFIPHA